MENKSNRTNVYIQIVLTTVLTILVSFITTFFLNERERAQQFNWDYKRYILEQRKDAYRNLEGLISSLIRIKFLPQIQEAAKSKTLTPAFIDSLDILERKSMWLSPEVSIQLDSVANVFRTFQSELAMDSSKANIMDAIHNYLRRTGPLRHQMLVTYFADIMSLDNIDEFRHKKSLDIRGITILE